MGLGRCHFLFLALSLAAAEPAVQEGDSVALLQGNLRASSESLEGQLQDPKKPVCSTDTSRMKGPLQEFFLDNRKLKSQSKGLQFRYSKLMHSTDKTQLAP